MKKLIALLLVLCMALGMVACGTKAPETPKNDEPKVETQNNDESKTEEPNKSKYRFENVALFFNCSKHDRVAKIGAQWGQIIFSLQFRERLRYIY